MKQTIICIKFEKPLNPGDASLVRGYLANQYPDLMLLHNHDGTGYRYKTPMVQYKVILNHAFLVGLNEGADILQMIAIKNDRFDLQNRVLTVLEREIQTKDISFGLATSAKRYAFVLPWMALNDKNYQRYVCLSPLHRNDLLKKILIGNLISLSKGLGYTVEDTIAVTDIRVKEKNIKLKGIPMLGFMGEFAVNFKLPNLWGIGKSTSRGFGTVISDDGNVFV